MSNLQNHKTKLAKYVTIGISISLVTAFVLLQPTQVLTAPPPSTTPDINSDIDHWGLDSISSNLSQIAQVNDCVLDPELQAPEPVDMNTVRVKGIAKTVHVEKEVFSCKILDRPVVVDVSIYTELIEDIERQQTNMKFEVATCVKYSKGILGCKTEVPPALTPEMPNMVCEAIPSTLPLEMNTVVDGRIVKTIEAEKEVFECDPDDNNVPTTILDVIIFTEIFEEVKNRGSEVINKKFDAALCIKEIDNAKVIGCLHQRIT